MVITEQQRTLIREAARDTQSEQRLNALFDELNEKLERLKPMCIAVERGPLILARFNHDAHLTYGNLAWHQCFGTEPLSLPHALTDALHDVIAQRNTASIQFEMPLDSQWHTYSAHLMLENPTAEQTSIIVHLQDITEARQTEAALRSSEARIRALLAASPDLMFRLKRDGTYLDYYAPRPEELAHPPEVLLGSKLPDLMSVDIANKCMACIESTLTTGQPTTTEYMINIDGHDLSFEARFVALAADEVTTVIRNITSSKRTQASLRAREEYLRSILQSLNDLVVLINTQGQIEQVYLPTNSNLFDRPEQYIGQKIDDLQLPEGQTQQFLKGLDHIANSDETVSFDFKLETLQGQLWFNASITRRYDADQQYAGAVIVARNITQRKAMEEELHLSRRAIEANSLGISIVDAQTGDMPIVYVNPAFEANTGYTADELVGQNCRILHGDDRNQPGLDNIRAAIKAGTDARVVLRNYRKNGEMFWNELRISPITNPDGVITHWIGIQHDITQRIQMEHALRTSEQDARAFQDDLKTLHQVHLELMQSPTLDRTYHDVVAAGQQRLGFDRIGLFLIDHENRQLMGTYGIDNHGMLVSEYDNLISLDSNPWIEEMERTPGRVIIRKDVTLYDYQQAVGKGWNAIVTVWDGQQVIGYIVTDNLINHEPPRPYLGELLTLYGAIVGHVITYKRMTNALRESEELYRRFVEVIPVGAAVHQRGQLIFCNPTALKILGEERLEDVIGKPILHFVAPEYREIALERAIEILKTGEAAPFQEEEFINSAGKVIEVEVGGIPFKREEGSILAVFTDISQRKAIERAHRESERLQIDLLKEQEMSELKSKMMVRISHEFRTPLSVILLASDSLTKHIDRMDDAQRFEKLSKIRSQVHHLTDILNDIERIVRGETRRLTFVPINIDVGVLIKETLAHLRETIGWNHELVMELPAAHQRIVHTDPGALRIVIERLFVNATRYSPPGTTIYIDVQIVGSTLKLTIRDEGIGITPEDLPRVFEPFYRGSNLGEIDGLGVGLTIVKDLIDLQGGHIHISSMPARGTTVEVMLANVEPHPEHA